MALFIARFMGALALDSATFEAVESDRHAWWQSVAVVLLTCVAGGAAAIGFATSDVRAEGFIIGMALTLGALAIWILLITLLGTHVWAEPQTQSDIREVMRTIGFAAAPGVFLAFAAIRPAAPFVFAAVAIWMTADSVLAVRQALDYRSTTRAIAVCVVAALVAAGVVSAFALLFTTTVA